MLYQVEHAGTGQPASVYVLLEHQSSAETVNGEVRTRIVQLLLMAASGNHNPEALRLAPQLAASPEASDESNL